MSIFLFIFALKFIPVGIAYAQNTTNELKIVSVVNDDVISAYDLDQRLRFVLITAGIKVSKESRDRLAPQVLRTMVEEKIKLQEGKRFGIQPDQKLVASQLKTFEQRNNIPLGRLPEVLQQNGANVDPFIKQLEAETVWRQLVRSRFAAGITISDGEIDYIINEMRAKTGKIESRVAEIFIPSESAIVFS